MINPAAVGISEVFEDSAGSPHEGARFYGMYRLVGTPSALEMLSSAII